MAHIVEHAQLDIGQRADCQGDLLIDKALHQPLVFDGTHAVVDALDLEQIQRFPDVRGWAFLAGVGHRVQAFATGLGEYPFKFARRVALLRAVQTHGDKGIAKGHGLFQGGEGVFLGQVAQKTEDQAVADA